MALPACGDDESAGPGAGGVRGDGTPQVAHAPRVSPARCPPGADNCSAASGRVVYVEAHDPDGDGDAHLVLASAESITAPGVSVIDVERNLRPHPLPVPGVEVSAAGPVFEGSYGQHQIQATELHVAER
jgi:hypothetical protein